MGLIISRFRRKKTTLELLERLENDINSIEQDRQYKEQTHKRVVSYVMAFSVGLYLLLAILYYYVYAGRSQHWFHSILYATPLFVMPLLVMFLRTSISWYYKWLLNKNRIKLNKMKEEKKKILEDVMNTETYKVAKQILDKFGPPEESSKALKPVSPLAIVRGSGASAEVSPVQLRQRQIAVHASTPVRANRNLLALPNTSTPLYKGPRLRSEQLPMPLADKDRTALDKVIEYLFRNGPNDRMALICTECRSHNGMAMVEEFEFTSYHCAYCGRFNPARKQRPAAPPLAPLSPMRALPAIPGPRDTRGCGDDSSGASSPNDSEDDEQVINGPTIASTGVGEVRPPSPMDEELKSAEDKKED